MTSTRLLTSLSVLALACLLWLSTEGPARSAELADRAARPADADADARAEHVSQVGPAAGRVAPERVHAYLSRLEAFGLAGGVLLAQDGEVLLARGYGLADRGSPETGGEAGGESDTGGAGAGMAGAGAVGSEAGDRSLTASASPRPWTAGTVSTVGSITKQFTAAAIMKLVDEGRLSVHDSIGRFFDGVPPGKRGITIHHLLTHSSGLGEAGSGDFQFLSREEIVREALTSELLGAPGEDYRYSNLGYSLLGAVVEVVTGADYERWVRDHLFQPAGMYETGYLLPDYQPDRVAVGYRRGERWGTIIEKLDPATGPSWVLRANGGINTTVYDMLRWVRALGVMPGWSGPGEEGAGPAPLLSAESRERMFSPQVDEGVGSWYGYGWVVDTTSRGTPTIRHNGGNGILHADLHLFPEEGLVTFMMTSDADLRATSLLDRVDAVLFGEDVPMPPDVESAPPHPAALRSLAGRYRLEAGGELRVRSAGTALDVEVEGQSAVDRVWRGERPGSVPYDTLNRRAATFVRAFGAGDFTTMRGLMGPDAPEEPYREFRERVLERMGALRDVEVLGTVPAWFHDGSSEATWVRIHFETASGIRRIHWSADGRVVGIGGQVYPAPVAFRCAMTGPAACTGWQAGLDLGAPRVRFERDEAGQAATVVIRVGRDEIRGRRHREGPQQGTAAGGRERDRTRR